MLNGRAKSEQCGKHVMDVNQTFIILSVSSGTYIKLQDDQPTIAKSFVQCL